ncbi:MAG: response regulator [Candidatus Scalindua sp.]|nr:response regulator [Candidatus Scalindua sp.]
MIKKERSDRNRKNIFNRGLGRSLLFWFLVFSISPLAAVSVVSCYTVHRDLYNEAERTLKSVSKMKTERIRSYFSRMLIDLKQQSEMQPNIELLELLKKEFRNSCKPLRDFVRSDSCTVVADDHGEDLRNYRSTYNFHDIYLIDEQGNILFTVLGEDNLGTNLFSEKYSHTLFANACKNALETEQLTFSDYEFYVSSGNQVSGFITSVIVNNAGNKIGLIAFQFTTHQIDEIMQADFGLAKTAEIYLVGPDLKMRSNSFLAKRETVLRDIIDTDQTLFWKNELLGKTKFGETEEKIFIYEGPHGKQVLGIHSQIQIAGVPFALIAEIEKKEAFASAIRQRNAVFSILGVTVIAVVFMAIIISRRIIRPVQKLSSSVKHVIEGQFDYGIEVTSRNEIGELAESFNQMLNHLRQTMGKNESHNRFNTGKTELNISMRGVQDAQTLGENIISYLSRFLNAQVGTIYIACHDKRLEMIGSYAYKRREHLANVFNPGEGMVGQAALEKKYILVTNCPDNYLKIHSSLGECVPKNILVLPLLMDNEVKGVIELGAFHEFSDLDLHFLEQVQEGIAIALNSVSTLERLSTLLEQTQQQSEEIQAREEELRSYNEELEIHTKALQESEERLQAQQEELRASNEELEEQKRNAEKKNRELEIAQKLIEQKASDLELSSRYKSEFLANMSHELRTPLNSILLLSKLLADNKDNVLTEDQTESARSIYSSGSELLELINEVLDLSKVEAGKMELYRENMDLKDFCRAMERRFKPLADEKKLEIEIDIEEGLPAHINTDRQRVEQIVKNFFSNAFKFTKHGVISLRISRPDEQIEEFDRAKTIAFSVSDTGIGIPKEKQELIFDAFQQADGTTSRKYGGTGLGLSISRELASLLGGEIRMKSILNRGSTFTLYLRETLDSKLKTEDRPPLNPSFPSGAERVRQSVTSFEKQKTIEAIEDDRSLLSPEDKSILIIEDDPGFVKILRELSHEHGFKCLIAGDGKTGLDFALYYKPSAIILDIGLPVINGLSVMTRLKEDPETRHIPVHIVSATDNKSDAMRMGAVNYLTKPVSQEALVQAFHKLNKIISKGVKELLVVEHNENQAKALTKFIGNGDVRITVAPTAAEAYDHVLSGNFECMILDLRLPDMSGLELLSKIRKNEDVGYIPIIVYTGKELTKQEKIIIDKYAESIIVKGADSERRILDETTLFLHRVEANLPKEKQDILRMLHDKEEILANKKILVVDDDMRNVFSIKKVLEGKGLQVNVGRNGKEGLERLEKDPNIDLILMDIMMPEMDGYEATRKIREQERFKDIPVIALTAKAMKDDRLKCIEAGANDYLAKPIDTDRLFSMLRVWLY